MPVKPSAVGKVSPYLWISVSSGPIPASPAMAPLRMIVFMIIAFGCTPLARAARGVGARGAQVEAEPGAVDDEVEGDAGQDGDDQEALEDDAARQVVADPGEGPVQRRAASPTAGGVFVSAWSSTALLRQCSASR